MGYHRGHQERAPDFNEVRLSGKGIPHPPRRGVLQFHAPTEYAFG